MKTHRVLTCATIAIGLAFAASSAFAQTMGEYAGVAAGTGIATSSSGFALQPPSEEQGNSSWSTSSYGPSSGGFGGSAIGQMPAFDARADDLTGGGQGNQGRWPGTGFVNRDSSSSSNDRFAESADRFPQTRFNDNGI